MYLAWIYVELSLLEETCEAQQWRQICIFTQFKKPYLSCLPKLLAQDYRKFP